MACQQKHNPSTLALKLYSLSENMKMLHLNFKTIWLFPIIATVMLLGVVPNSYAIEEPKELRWEDLVPKGWNPNSVFDRFTNEEFAAMSDEQYFALQEEVQKMLEDAPTVDSLDGQTVRIPGYLLPLEFDEAEIKEFLLVPYFGACTHTPPPPANQVIYGKLQSTFTMNQMYEPVWISGKLKTLRSQSKLGESGLSQTIDVDTGYTMEVDDVAPYEEVN